MTINFFSRKYFFLVQTECQCENIYWVNLKTSVQHRFSCRKLSNLKLVTNVATWNWWHIGNHNVRNKASQGFSVLAVLDHLSPLPRPFSRHRRPFSSTAFVIAEQTSGIKSRSLTTETRNLGIMDGEDADVWGLLPGSLRNAWTKKMIWCFSGKKLKITDSVVKYTSVVNPSCLWFRNWLFRFRFFRYWHSVGLHIGTKHELGTILNLFSFRSLKY